VEKEKKLSPTFARPWADVVISLWYLTGSTHYAQTGRKRMGRSVSLGQKWARHFSSSFSSFAGCSLLKC
jgi:hypothetical protein